MFAPSQWETALLCNDVSQWLGTNLESALLYSLVVVTDGAAVVELLDPPSVPFLSNRNMMVAIKAPRAMRPSSMRSRVNKLRPPEGAATLTSGLDTKITMTSWHGNPVPHYWLFLMGIHQWLLDFHHKGPVIRSLDVFFAVGLNKLLSKQLSSGWLETSRVLMWRHCHSGYPCR